MTKPNKPSNINATKIANVHFLYFLALAGSIIVYDATKVLTPEAVLDRWKYAIALLVTVTVVWYISKIRQSNAAIQKLLIAALVLSDIFLAGLIVYADRGMASPAVILFAVPIVVAAGTGSRSAILATASLSAATYSFAAMKYFTDFFNEGYRAQLYITLGLYSAVFFVIALILVSIYKKQK